MKNLILIFCFFLSKPAFAFLEIRYLTSNITGAGVESFNNILDTTVTNTPNLDPNQKTTGWDVRIVLPIFPLSVGYRSESWSSESSGSGNYQSNAAELTTKFTAHRNSALLGYRFFSNPLFVAGLLAHYGIDTQMEFKREVSYGSTTRTNVYKGKMDSSYGLGIEGHVYLWKLVVGGEVGYSVLKASSIEDNSEYIATPMSGQKWDFSGTYMMLSAGLNF